MAAVEIMMLAQMRPIVVTALERDYTLHKWWLEPDKEAALARWAPNVSILAAGGYPGKVDAAFMRRFPKLEIVVASGLGYDRIDAAWAGANGIVVTNTPGPLIEEVADTAMGLLIMAARQLHAGDRFVRSGAWLKGQFPFSATLRNRKMGILGLGRIGKAIARRAETFGLPVSYHGRSRQDSAYPYYGSLIDLARAVDVLVVATPGGPETRHMVDAQILDALGPDGILINIGRGSIVDEAALIEALRAKTILSAGLDVFEDEPNVPQALIDMPHVVLSPHMAGSSHYSRDANGVMFVDNIRAWLAGKGPLNPVAETPWPQTGQRRKGTTR